MYLNSTAIILFTMYPKLKVQARISLHVHSNMMQLGLSPIIFRKGRYPTALPSLFPHPEE